MATDTELGILDVEQLGLGAELGSDVPLVAVKLTRPVSEVELVALGHEGFVSRGTIVVIQATSVDDAFTQVRVLRHLLSALNRLSRSPGLAPARTVPVGCAWRRQN
jgi:hypothetical protein